MGQVIRLGTRGSRLALWQTEHVAARLRELRPGVRFETIVISTVADRQQEKALADFGETGLFTTALEDALRDGSVDLAVHSLKDLPTECPAGLVVAAVLARVDPADVLVSRERRSLATLPSGACVGTSSPRRKAQLLLARPDLQVIDLRGNIDTRLRKAFDEQGPYDAVIIARAALERLGRLDALSDVLPEDLMLPAPGQGALAVECRDDEASLELVRGLDDLATHVETCAERSFLDALGGGCAVPVAARGRLDDGRLRLKGRACAPDGSVGIDVALDVALPCDDGARQRAEEAGRSLAEEALVQGAARLLDAEDSSGRGE